MRITYELSLLLRDLGAKRPSDTTPCARGREKTHLLLQLLELCALVLTSVLVCDTGLGERLMRETTSLLTFMGLLLLAVNTYDTVSDATH